MLCEPKGPGDHQAGDCCVNPKDQEITRQVSVASTQTIRRLPGGSVLRQPKVRSPGGCLLCEPKGPGDQAGDCCVNPKDHEITRRVSVVWTEITRQSQTSYQAGQWPGGCCVNPKDHDQIVMLTQRTRRSPDQCCVNPKDQEIRRVIVC